LVTDRKGVCSIGIDVCRDGLTVAQLARHQDKDKVGLLAASRVSCPDEGAFGTPAWQRWAVEALRQIVGSGGFRGKGVTTALPAGDVFITCIECPAHAGADSENEVFSAVARKLPTGWVRENTIIQCIPTEQERMVVMAAERTAIDRHLAIYERAGLAIKSISVWPVALTECYATLFAKHAGDLIAVVMLVAFQTDRISMVVTRHRSLLYASSVPVRRQGVQDKEYLGKSTAALASCRREFSLLYHQTPIERLIFFSGPTADPRLCQTLATQMEIRAQLADCLQAVRTTDSSHSDPRVQGADKANWAFSFGLSLC
jgi:Tfp pilus assembly PilM family ATPase